MGDADGFRKFVSYGVSMSMNDKLTSLNQRMDELRRELSDLAAVRPHSDNAALVDLENALMRELAKVEAQVRQIQNYIDRCSPVGAAD